MKHFSQYSSPDSGLYNKTVFLLRYEDLMDPDGGAATMRKLLAFIGEEAKITPEKLQDIIRSLPPVENKISMSTAFEFMETFIWESFKDCIQGFGYSKPLSFHSNSTDGGNELSAIGNVLPKRRFLTYVPTGGELADQLWELEIAIQLAIQSKRKLVLPPLQKPSNQREVFDFCVSKEDDDHMQHQANRTETLAWDTLVDWKDLLRRVYVVEDGGEGIPPGFSVLTLSGYDRCNSRWDLRPRKPNQRCRHDFTVETRTTSNSSIPTRSPQCVFDATRAVHVIRFIDLIGTFQTKFISPKARLAEPIQDALDTSLEAGLAVESDDLTDEMSFDFNVTDSPPFSIFYSIFVREDGGEQSFVSPLKIVKEHMKQVGQSYAASFDSKVTVFYNTIGPSNGLETAAIQNICRQNNLKCVQMAHYEEGREEFTLQKVHEYCHVYDSHRVIYMHTEGSDPNIPPGEEIGIRMTEAVTSEMCLAPKKETCNLCGLVYYPFGGSSMPGDFWTAGCSYIQKLVPPRAFKEKNHNLMKEVLMLKALGKFSSRMFPQLEGSNSEKFHGLGEYAAKHWIGSHPSVVPCDLSNTVDLDFVAGASRDGSYFEFSLAPRSPVDSPWFGGSPRITDKLLHNIRLRTKEYSLLAGRLFLWLGLYDEVPQSSSWVWTWFPDGQQWRQLSRDGENRMKRLYKILEEGSFENDGANAPWSANDLNGDAVQRAFLKAAT